MALREAFINKYIKTLKGVPGVTSQLSSPH